LFVTPWNDKVFDNGIFFIGVNLYQKLVFLAILGAVCPYFLCQNSEIWYEGADLGLPPPRQIL